MDASFNFFDRVLYTTRKLYRILHAFSVHERKYNQMDYRKFNHAMSKRTGKDSKLDKSSNLTNCCIKFPLEDIENLPKVAFAGYRGIRLSSTISCSFLLFKSLGLEVLKPSSSILKQFISRFQFLIIYEYKSMANHTHVSPTKKNFIWKA